MTNNNHRKFLQINNGFVDVNTIAIIELTRAEILYTSRTGEVKLERIDIPVKEIEEQGQIGRASCRERV